MHKFGTFQLLNGIVKKFFNCSDLVSITRVYHEEKIEKWKLKETFNKRNYLNHRYHIHSLHSFLFNSIIFFHKSTLNRLCMVSDSHTVYSEWRDSYTRSNLRLQLLLYIYLHNLTLTCRVLNCAHVFKFKLSNSCIVGLSQCPCLCRNFVYCKRTQKFTISRHEHFWMDILGWYVTTHIRHFS